MADLNKFGKEVADFRNGVLVYSYSFNSVGNLYFRNTSENLNQVFLKISVSNFEYNASKIAELYNLKFEEFTDSTAVVEENPKITELEKTVDELRNKLAEAKSLNKSSSNNSEKLKTSVDESDTDKLESEVKASKDLIIQLRISSGEGKSERDFSDEFPYFFKKTTPTPPPTV